MHVLSAIDLVDLDFFASYTTAAVFCGEARRAGWLRQVGIYREFEDEKLGKKKRGQAELQHCNGWWPKQDNMRHEKETSRFCFLYYGDFDFRRGPFVDERYPDFEMYRGKEMFAYGELDCGTQTRAKFQRRMEKYLADSKKKRAESGHDVLIVVSDKRGDSERRLGELAGWSGAISHLAHLTTLDRLIEHGPYASVWEHFDGEQWVKTGIDPPESLPESVQGGAQEMAEN